MLTEILAVIGIILSAYSIYVKYSNKKQLCDINYKVSCSKAIKSKAGTHFGIPNGVYGLVFYLLIIFIPQIYLFVTLAGVIASIYLFIRLKQICIVCYLVYIINIVLFVMNFF